MTDILITGGTGFFGNAFVEKVLETGEYERVCIFSRDEYKQHLMREKFYNHPSLRFFIGDVRDRDRLTRAMQGIDVVIHAAALKRIEVGAYNPDEMVKTNIIGTMNVIDAACSAEVKRVVFLSSDKAWQPCSAYGQSKALAESLILSANDMYDKAGPTFHVTRYGNVAGSTGSIIPVWRNRISEGKHITVTDPRCTRFWMTAQQAVDLVFGAADTWSDDEKEVRLHIPKLPAFRIGDLAEAMGAEAIDVVGLRSFEKLHEGMCDGNTSDIAGLLTVKELKSALESV